MSLWLVFLTGLTTGGLSCLAMQGGLLASIIANQKESELESSSESTKSSGIDTLDWLPVGLFLVSKLLAHTVLGFLLGWLGGQLQLSLPVRLLFQVLTALYMLATAGNLLNLHPWLRYVVVQPPKFFHRFVKNTTKGKALFTPAFLGLLTILIPCGVTQAMEVLAISSGSAVAGALIMFFFVLGTSPVFAVVGVATAKLSETFTQRFMKVAAVLLLLFALSNLNGVLVVMNSPVTFEKITQPVRYFFSNDRFVNQEQSAVPTTGVQKVTISIENNGYNPKRFKVRAGQPVELTLVTNETYSCASSFVMKAFNLNLQLGPNDSQTVTFTPTKKGRYQFSCSMGMYTGVMEVE